MSNLTDFLLARIAEDEAIADTFGDTGVAFGGTLLPPERWRAEIEAKRRIVEELTEAIAWDQSIHEAVTTTADAGMTVLNHLASIYADHPDYREEWEL